MDIGGANLKASDGGGWALWRPFPLWQRRDELPDALADLLRQSPPADALAVTMTGELADCFSTKAEGVETILAAVAAAACGRAIWVYRVRRLLGGAEGGFASAAVGRGVELARAGLLCRALRRRGLRW